MELLRFPTHHGASTYTAALGQLGISQSDATIVGTDLMITQFSIVISHALQRR